MIIGLGRIITNSVSHIVKTYIVRPNLLVYDPNAVDKSKANGSRNIYVIVKSTAPKPHAFTLAHTVILWNDWLLCYYSMPNLAIIDCPFPTLPEHQLVLQPELFPECFIIQEVALINVSVQWFSSRVLSLSPESVLSTE